MLKDFKKKITIALLILIANFIFYSIAYFSSGISNRQIIVKTIKNNSYSSEVEAPKVLGDTWPIIYKSLSLQFEADFFPKDDNYGNIFQTAKDPKTLRIELINPKSLQVIVGYNSDSQLKVYPISRNVKMNEWNKINLIYKENGLHVKLNNENEVVIKDEKLNPLVSEVVLGAGFNSQRVFSGEIKNANFKIGFTESSPLFFTLSFISNYYFLFLLFQILFLVNIYYENQFLRKNDMKIRSVFFNFLTVFSIFFLVIFPITLLLSPLEGQRKWIPYLSILLPSFIFSLSLLKINFFEKKIFPLLGILISLILFRNAIVTHDTLSWFGFSGILILFSVFSMIPIIKYFSLISALIFVFLFGMNSFVFVNIEGGQFWTVIVIILFLFLVPVSLLYPIGNNKIWNRINKIGFVFLVPISLIFSIRSDSLFLGSSEFHWNYYTGVIQTVRSGGELLWSSPSQYGFLNIMLPTILPWSSRISFFIFQAGLFFITMLLILKTIYLPFKKSGAFLILSTVSISLFFFADPSMIGPAPFPSSSVMRFFWCYVLIFTILLDYYRKNIINGRIKWLTTTAFIFSALWSAESFLYGVAIYGTYLAASSISIFKVKKSFPINFLAKNIFLIFFAFTSVVIFYLVVTRHLPDFSMFFMYAFSYANGYGELLIKPFGIYWSIIITLSSIIFISYNFYIEKKFSEWTLFSVCFVSLWILFSYYIGRAVPNNITALLPLIFYIFVVMFSILMNFKNDSYKILLLSVFLPWIIVGLIGGVANPNFIQNIQTLKFAENIDSKSIKLDKQLEFGLKKLGVSSKTPIIYYGEPYNNPLLNPKKEEYVEPLVGAPTPLTLLEEPIPVYKREIIMKRFLKNLNEPVLLIHKKNENMGRFLIWKKFLEQKGSIMETSVINGDYEIYFFKKN